MVSRGLSYDSGLFDLIPGKRPLPVLGHALDVAVAPPRFLRALADLCAVSDSGVTRLYLAHRPYVVLTKADAVEVVLSSHKHISKGPDYRFIQPWLGLGLLTADGERWKARRKMITPAFHFNILEDFLQVRKWIFKEKYMLAIMLCPSTEIYEIANRR
jgi:cytochrome P450